MRIMFNRSWRCLLTDFFVFYQFVFLFCVRPPGFSTASIQLLRTGTNPSLVYLSVGCTTTISPDGDQQPRICPRCHNGGVYFHYICPRFTATSDLLSRSAAVVSAKSRNWFEVCFVPLIPMNSKHVWMCSICQWSVPLQQG